MIKHHAQSILKFCLLITTILSSGCGSVTSIPFPVLTPLPSQMPKNTSAPISMTTEIPILTATNTQKAVSPTPFPEFGWSVLFKYDFEENYWKAGKHSYRIIADCPDTDYFGDFDGIRTFKVDKNAYLWPALAIIEFSYNYIGVKWDGYSMYQGSFHPQQKSRILFGYQALSLEQVNQAIKECQVRAIVDGEEKLILLPDNPIPWPSTFGAYHSE